jgi:hypothetical protein
VKTPPRLIFAIACTTAVVAFLGWLSNSQAQTAAAGLTRSVSPTTLISGGTNNVLAGASNAYTARIDVPKADSFSLLLSAKPVGTNTTTLTFTLQKSLDGTTWSTTSPSTVSLTGSTTNATAVGVVNVQAGAIPYWRLTYVQNSETEGYATNLTVKYGFKQ